LQFAIWNGGGLVPTSASNMIKIKKKKV